MPKSPSITSIYLFAKNRKSIKFYYNIRVSHSGSVSHGKSIIRQAFGTDQNGARYARQHCFLYPEVCEAFHTYVKASDALRPRAFLQRIGLLDVRKFSAPSLV